jgi:hypothetical protein
MLSKPARPFREVMPASLHYVAQAIGHAEGLADEAEYLKDVTTADRLRGEAKAVRDDLEGVERALREVDGLRLARAQAHRQLDAAYHRASAGDDVITPPAIVDVAERTRSRLRRAPPDAMHALREALAHFDASVDAFLDMSARSSSGKQRVIYDGQMLRLRLEEEKRNLLAQATEPTQLSRIRARAVRTKMPRWAGAAAAVRAAKRR